MKRFDKPLPRVAPLPLDSVARSRQSNAMRQLDRIFRRVSVMFITRRHSFLFSAFAIALASHTTIALGQAEANSWGCLRGIRFAGELVPVTTGFRAIRSDGAPIISTNYEQEKLADPKFTRTDAVQTITGRMLGTLGIGPTLTGQVTYEDANSGIIRVDVQVSSRGRNPVSGTYFLLHLPGEGPLQVVRSTGAIYLATLHRSLQITATNSDQFVVQERPDQMGFDVYVPISKGDMANLQTNEIAFMLSAACDPDNTPINITVDSSHPGSPFTGIGGNFRIQNAVRDMPIVEYNLANLHPTWGRVAMPLDQWQPNENRDPLTKSADATTNSRVSEDMEMAKALADRNIPIIISVWATPRWAVLPPVERPSGGGRTSHLNPAKWDHIARAIGSYLLCLKTNYGVEPKLFSFNEPDLGWNVLQTPQEHADGIKRLGTWFAAHGLTTKFLLGDTGDPGGIAFISKAMGDPDAVKFLGAVSFHSWRGGTVQQYDAWGEAARQLSLPLIVGEGGTDSDASSYPALLTEPWYSINEIGEYIDICRFSQPASILEWQFTADYPLVLGGTNGRPPVATQRFWQLDQLGMTPPGAKALPVACDRPNVAVCAFGDTNSAVCAIHLVNSGAARDTTITGLPTSMKALRVYITDAHHNAQRDVASIVVKDGEAHFTLNSMAYTTLLTGP